MLLFQIMLTRSQEFNHYQDVSSTDGKGEHLLTYAPNLAPLISGKRGLILLLGSCDSCTIKKWTRGNEGVHNYDYVLEVFDSRGTEHLPKTTGRYIAILDTDGVLHGKLRAFLPPRGYIANRNSVIELAETGSRDSELFQRK